MSGMPSDPRPGWGNRHLDAAQSTLDGADELLKDVEELSSDIKECPGMYDNKLGIQSGGQTQKMTDPYVTKDSGERIEYESGMRRDIADGKPRYDLIPILPLRRLADLYTRGAEKYGDCNWQLADSDEELQRFKASGLRHFFQALNGEADEDHWIAAAWNIFAVVWLMDKMGS